MTLEDFLKMSALPKMEISSLYLKPNIPQDKLSNALREYAPNVGMSSVIVLVDETFWGNAKEGMIITNEKIILSKKLGGRVIPIASVTHIAINDKHLIVNDLPLAKFNNPEVMPLRAFGGMLNEFAVATRKVAGDPKGPTPLDHATTEKIIHFLARIAKPLYFESAPIAQRKPGATTPNYVLAEKLTEEQCQLMRFKGGLNSAETIFCVSWLDTHGVADSFFCVTDSGVYSVGSSESVVFISHEDLCNLSVVEEYKVGRYIGLRLSNGQDFIVSVQNVFFRPYAHELFDGVIEIINGREPKSRVSKNDFNQQETVFDSSSASCSETETTEGVIKPASSVEVSRTSQRAFSPIPFTEGGSDRLFDLILKLNSIDNVGDFIGSFFADSQNTNSKIRKIFQSCVAASIKCFRKEIVENGGFSQFKNDVATLEICGAVMALAFIQMLERGVDGKIATRVLLEGIRVTFNIKASAQSDPIGASLITIVESYVPDEDEIESTEEMFLQVMLRLIGSNVTGKLRPEYAEVLQKYAHHLEDFVPGIDSNFTKFMNKTTSEVRYLVDAVLDTRW